MKKSILITGASGFIGSSLVEEAVRRGYQTFAGIRASSNKQYLSHPGISFIDLDYHDPEKLQHQLELFSRAQGRFDYVIHNAGVTKAKETEEFDLVNCTYTRHFVEALEAAQMVPEKFVYISSLASFGPGFGIDPINTLQVPHPVTAYGKSKLRAEQFLYSCHDLPFLIINPTAVYGPRDKDFFFLIDSIRKHLELYIGSSNQLLSLVHVHDLVAAIFLGMESGARNQNLIVSDLEIYSAKTVNSLIKKVLDSKTISITVPPILADFFALLSEAGGRITGKVPLLNRERLKEFKAKNWSADCSEITELGFTPQYNLEEGLKHTIGWYKENNWLP